MAAKQKAAGVVLVLAALVLAEGMVTYHALAGERESKGANPEPATENFGKEEEAIRFAKDAFARHLMYYSKHLPQINPMFRATLMPKWGIAQTLPGAGIKARLDRKSGHWIVTYNEWSKIPKDPSASGSVFPFDKTVIVKYQPSKHSWKEVWYHDHVVRLNRVWEGKGILERGRLGLGGGLGWLPYPAKRHKGRTLKEWADDLEEPDLDVIDRARRSVQAFGEDGLPYLIVQAQKHPPGSEQRRLIAAFIRVPAAEAWRQPGIDFLHELLKDPAQATRDAARNALKQAGLQ
jgi:hypothetical protein